MKSAGFKSIYRHAEDASSRLKQDNAVLKLKQSQLLSTKSCCLNVATCSVASSMT